MIAPPAPHLSPMATLVDAMRRRWIRMADPHIAQLEQQLDQKVQLNEFLKGGAS